MATMIPSRYDAATSSAERKVFERLRDDPDTTGWTVLHSLALSRRGRKPYGEIDFVVLVPERGIACLEVKGGRVSCRDGVWRTKDRNGIEASLTRSPFQQAREGMFALRDALRSNFSVPDSAAQTLLAAAVVLPDIEALPRTLEFEHWECLDLQRLRRPISTLILDLLRGQAGRLGIAAHAPEAGDLRRIRTFLRPDFDAIVARGTTIERSEERLLKLTQEQFEMMDNFDSNERCLVEGAAGTGKTMLALEFARRCADSGKRTLLLCYNRMLGSWLSEQVQAAEMAFLSAGTFHGLLRQKILESSFSSEFLRQEAHADPKRLFGEWFPFYGELALSELDVLPEVLVIDEAQDLVNERYLAVLNAWLRSGLAGGRWLFLGDFTRQSIYDSGRHLDAEPDETNDQYIEDSDATQNHIEMMRESAPHFATLRLRVNCRNTRPIGEETALLSGFESLPYRLDGHDSLPVDYRWWHTKVDQANSLSSVLDTLASQGVASDEIVVLSPKAFEHSAAHLLRDDPQHPIVAVNDATARRRGAPKQIRFSTLQAFKGMESAVVVLCDVERMTDRRSQSLLYTGMSRAKSHLVALLHDSQRAVLRAAVERRLTSGWK